MSDSRQSSTFKVAVKLVGGLGQEIRLPTAGRQAADLGMRLPRGGWVELNSGATVLVLLEQLRLPPSRVWGVIVNGKHAQPTDLLQEGDEVFVIPPIGGG
jgi:sulfur carrier protein ThiS